jgi:aminoglycoside phosphotransferase (APT) family kinase protein
MNYSERLGEITVEQIQLVVNKYGLGKLVATEKVQDGLFGQNLFFSTSHGEYVLRGKPHFDWQFPLEKFFAERLFKEGIPTPTPYILDEDTSIFGWSFVIMPRLEGTRISSKLDESYLTDEDRKSIASAQGTFLAKVQTAQFEKPGRYNYETDKIDAFDGTYSEHLLDRIKARLEKAQQSRSGYTYEQDLAWVETLLNKAQDAGINEFIPTVVLQDYKFENTLVKKVGGNWEICALFDLMECYIGNGEADLSRTYCKYIASGREDLAQIFLSSWADISPNSQNHKKRLPFFITLDRSIIWEWRMRDINAETTNFRSYARKYLKF